MIVYIRQPGHPPQQKDGMLDLHDCSFVMAGPALERVMKVQRGPFPENRVRSNHHGLLSE